jgi:hypothetical protein
VSTRSEYRYVYSVIQTFEAAENLDRDRTPSDSDRWRCPHGRVMDYFRGPIVYCHDCMRPGLARLVDEGARDDEIVPAFKHLPIPERRWMEATLDELRSRPRAADEPTPYARAKLTKIRERYPELKRRFRRVSKSRVAIDAEVDRGTLDEWIRRGWLEWPPE